MQYETLESVSEKIDYGLTASATEKNTGIKFLRITDIQDDRVNWNTVPFCECSEADAKQFALGQGEILFARTGSVGKSYLVNTIPPRAVFASYLIRVRLNQDVVHPPFLAYFFRSQNYWRQITETAVGGIQLGVNATKLSELRIPLIPLPEQRRIAALLDKADRLRRTRRYAAQLSDTFLPAVFVQVFGDPVPNPMGWEVFRLEDIAQINPSTPKAKEFGDTDEVSFIPMAAVDENIFTTQTSEVRKYNEVSKNFTIFQENDVLFAKITPCMENGKIVLAKNLLSGVGFGSTEFHVIRNAERTTPEWLLWLVRRNEFRNSAVRAFTGTAGQQRVPASFLENYIAPLPPLVLQQTFARIVQQVERLRAQQWEAERQAEHLFQTLLHRAFV